MKDESFVIILLAAICWIILLFLIVSVSKVFGWGLTWRSKKLWTGVIVFILISWATYPCENWRCRIVASSDADYSPKSFAVHRATAEQGDWKAQRWLGHNYQLGDGVEQDFPEAYFWLGLSCYYQYASETLPSLSIGDRQTKEKMSEIKIGECLLQPLPPDSKGADILTHLTSEQKRIIDKRIRDWISNHR